MSMALLPHHLLLSEVKVKVLVAQSCLILCDSMDYNSPGSSCPWNSPGKNAGVSSYSLLEGIFLS